MPNMNEYVKILKVKDGNKDKKNKRSMYFYIDEKKLLEKYKAIFPRLKKSNILI